MFVKILKILINPKIFAKSKKLKFDFAKTKKIFKPNFLIHIAKTAFIITIISYYFDLKYNFRIKIIFWAMLLMKPFINIF